MKSVPLRWAQERYWDALVLAALGALEKKPGSGDVRIIFDGTHGVLTNERILYHGPPALPHGR